MAHILERGFREGIRQAYNYNGYNDYGMCVEISRMTDKLLEGLVSFKDILNLFEYCEDTF